MAQRDDVTVRDCGFEELDPRTAYDVWRLRQKVFVLEQECLYGDLDGRDVLPETRHVLLEDETGELLGYLRILYDEELPRIGRVVLRRTARGRGLGDQLMQHALQVIGDQPSTLEAQAPLAQWYATFGYEVVGDQYLDDGIPHVPMRRS